MIKSLLASLVPASLLLLAPDGRAAAADLTRDEVVAKLDEFCRGFEPLGARGSDISSLLDQMADDSSFQFAHEPEPSSKGKLVEQFTPMLPLADGVSVRPVRHLVGKNRGLVEFAATHNCRNGELSHMAPGSVIVVDFDPDSGKATLVHDVYDAYDFLANLGKCVGAPPPQLAGDVSAETLRSVADADLTAYSTAFSQPGGPSFPHYADDVVVRTLVDGVAARSRTEWEEYFKNVGAFTKDMHVHRAGNVMLGANSVGYHWQSAVRGPNGRVATFDGFLHLRVGKDGKVTHVYDTWDHEAVQAAIAEVTGPVEGAHDDL